MKCRTLGPYRRLDEGARLGGVVGVIAERVRDRFRHDDLGGEMRDRVDRMLADDPRHQRLVTEIALDEGRLRGHRPAEPGRQIVEHHDGLAGIAQGQRHVAADVARPARHQHAHRADPSARRPRLTACLLRMANDRGPTASRCGEMSLTASDGATWRPAEKEPLTNADPAAKKGSDNAASSCIGRITPPRHRRRADARARPAPRRASAAWSDGPGRGSGAPPSRPCRGLSPARPG